MQLRPYQLIAEESILEGYREGVRSQLVIMPTGTGKTVLFAQAPKWFPGTRTLVLCHTEELVDQAADKIRRSNPTLSIGVEMADRYCRSSDDVIVGSVPTLGREGSERLARLSPDDFGVVVIDEAHHSIAPTYLRIAEYFGFGLRAPSNHNRLLLGVTATGERGDKRGLGRLFQKKTYEYSMLQAIKDGWICPPRGYRVYTGTCIDDVPIVAGDFAQNELSETVNTSSRNELIVQQWCKFGDNRQSLFFTVDIEHAQNLARAFSDSGVCAAAVWGDDPDRARKLQMHREGRIKVLTNCSVLVEGYDDWRIGCIGLCAPTKSKLRFVQWIGRGLRLQDGTGNLKKALANGVSLSKKDCIILDFQDATTQHSLVSLSSLFGLPPALQMAGRNVEEQISLMEKLEADFPNVDFSHLDDVDHAQTYIEKVDLFNTEADPVIVGLTDWRWVLNARGEYVLHLPNLDHVTISQNIIGDWEVHGQVTGVQFDDSNPELATTIEIAERLTKQFWKGRVSTLKRKQVPIEHRLPPSQQQVHRIKVLAGLTGQNMPDLKGLNYAQAEQIIRDMVR